MKDQTSVNQTAMPRISLIGLLALLAIAVALSVMTAKECHSKLVLSHLVDSFAPSLLFGIVMWFWWVCIAIVIWQLAQRNPSFLRFTPLAIVGNAGVGCLVALVHLFLLQKTIALAGAHWTVWGELYFGLNLQTSIRFGGEMAIYGVVFGFSGLLFAQAQTRHTQMLKLEVERQLTQAQLKALQMQLEPHFLFNTLNAITSLVAHGRNQEAMKTLSHLNNILRMTLQRQAPEKVPVAEELKVIESYLAIQKVRFAKRLEIKIDVTQEAMDGLVPCFLLQPIVENAIQHGISPSEIGGLVETDVRKVGDQLWMQIRDNGCGLSTTATKGHGIGMQNTKERLAYFYPGTHAFEAGPRDEGGFKVTIQIPYERIAS